jgi:acetoin utilization deacetylase AcuC-like enzyme
LETEDFEELTRAVLKVANDYAGGRVVSVLEGGYNPPVLTECVKLHLENLLDFARRPREPRRAEA